MNISGSRILVTGASGGLGSAVAAELGRRGGQLALTSRDQTRLNSVEANGARLAADLRLPSSAVAVVDWASRELGGLDGVVNAAGVVAFGTSADTDPDTVEELFLTNAFLPIFLFDAAAAVLHDGGTLLNITGVVAEQPMAGMAAYSASKAAIAAHLVALRRELRRRNITVIDARPGHTETDLSRHPIAGEAPAFKPGLAPESVAARLVDAIEGDEKDLGPDRFA
jgi:cyclic-di-GMP-binding biofilm dispersal mediator protein